MIIYLSLRKFYVINLSQNCCFMLTPLKGGLLMDGFIGSTNLLQEKIHKTTNNNKYINTFTIIYFKVSSKRQHNHNATAEVEYLKNKTNNETVFQRLLTQFFLFPLALLFLLITNNAMLALDCSLLRLKPFPLITYDRSDFSSAKRMHLNASSSIMAIAYVLIYVFNLSMLFKRLSSCLSISLLSFFFFLRFKMEPIFQM